VYRTAQYSTYTEHFEAQRTHWLAITKTNLVILFRNITVVYSENHIKHINSEFFVQYKAVHSVSIVLGEVSGVSFVPRNTNGLILHDGPAEGLVN
jgi:hypothetical protein